MKEITKEQALELKEGTQYLIYNPLSETYKIEIASKKDIVHNKHCYENLKFYLLGV